MDSRYSGLSYEKNKLAVSMFTGTNAALIQLFRLLGPSVLRIGASQVDRSSWNGAVSGLTAILPAQIDALAAFVQATQWQVIYGVNMARNTAANAASEASYVASRLGSSLLAWEIGNEPDLYRRLGYRPDSWAYADYLAEWRALHEANSFYNGGRPNVSNAYGTAFWGLDFMFTCAVSGCTGVNLHSGGSGRFALNCCRHLGLRFPHRGGTAT